MCHAIMAVTLLKILNVNFKHCVYSLTCPGEKQQLLFLDIKVISRYNYLLILSGWKMKELWCHFSHILGLKYSLGSGTFHKSVLLGQIINNDRTSNNFSFVTTVGLLPFCLRVRCGPVPDSFWADLIGTELQCWLVTTSSSAVLCWNWQ